MERAGASKWFVAARNAGITALSVVAATCVGLLFRHAGFPETNVVIMYILCVLITARFTRGYRYGILGSLVATFTYNFFFTEPYFTLSVNDPSYFITFAVMTATAITTGALTTRERQSALEAGRREAQTSALYRLTNRLTDAGDAHGIADVAADSIGGVFGCGAAFLCFGEDGRPESEFVQREENGARSVRALGEKDALRLRAEAPKTNRVEGPEFTDWPVNGRETVLGVVRIPAGTDLDPSQTRLLHSMIESTALAMDRLRSARQRIQSSEEAERERYRGNLLRSISHDLRTPLSGIMGTAEILIGMTDPEDPRHELAEGIYRETAWLHSLVENILSLTRLKDGALALKKQPVPVEEAVGGAVNRVMRATGREIGVEAPEEVLFVPMDAGLIEQALVNLLENAVKHTRPGEPITIRVRKDETRGCAEFHISDRGEGIRPEDLPHVFQLFYTTPIRRADAARGVGLGLTICEAIVKAHGGEIEARNRSDGPGAEIRFTLPLEDEHDAKAD